MHMIGFYLSQPQSWTSSVAVRHQVDYTSTLCPLQAHLMISESSICFSPFIVENVVVHLSRMLMQARNLRLGYELEDNNEKI